MQPIFAVTLRGMQQDIERLDRTALNLANVSTAGYKREVVIARPFIDAMDDIGALAGTPPADATLNTSSAAAVQVLFDTHAGTLKMTGNPLDVALDGDGFFEVTTEHGPAYTRQGDFKLDARGRLVTAKGYPVMGKNGDIYLTTPTPVIDAMGNVTEPNATTGPSAMAPGTPVDQIKVVRFDDAKSLQRLGEGLVAPGPGMSMVGEANVRLRQGALENSNVSSLQEMMQMMQTMRHFESMQKITQGYDDMIGTAIRKLGDLS